MIKFDYWLIILTKFDKIDLSSLNKITCILHAENKGYDDMKMTVVQVMKNISLHDCHAKSNAILYAIAKDTYTQPLAMYSFSPWLSPRTL